MSDVETVESCSEQAAENRQADQARPASTRKSAPPPALHGAVLGVLIGFQDDGRTPLVIFPGQIGDAAVAARAAQDIHGAHIGREVVLVFEGGDPLRPIIVGCMQRDDGGPLTAQANPVEVEADGERLIVSAKEQLVLRCGSASITLTKSGKVLVQGTYVSNRSSGVIRIKGGSVLLN
jgi:hypothetical protein